MTNNNYDDAEFDSKYPDLGGLDKSILLQFNEDERDAVYELIQNVDKDKLSYESLRLLLDEYKLFKNIGSGFINIARENFDLREKLRKERKITIISIISNVLTGSMILVLLYLFTVYPKYRTIQTIDNSVICELKPEDNPMLTDVAIQDFAKQAVLSSYSYDYINWRTQIENATTRYYTADGRASFNKAIRASGSLDYIIRNNLIMKSMAISSPQIEEKGLDNSGTPYWIVRMPITTEFYTGASKPADSQSFVAQVKVVTTKRDAFNPKGLGVYSMILKPYKEIR